MHLSQFQWTQNKKKKGVGGCLFQCSTAEGESESLMMSINNRNKASSALVHSQGRCINSWSETWGVSRPPCWCWPARSSSRLTGHPPPQHPQAPPLHLRLWLGFFSRCWRLKSTRQSVASEMGVNDLMGESLTAGVETPASSLSSRRSMTSLNVNKSTFARLFYLFFGGHSQEK